MSRFPAIPSPGWCAKAAQTIGQIRTDAAVSITIAEFDESGGIRRIESESACVPDMPGKPKAVNTVRKADLRSMNRKNYRLPQ